jgi:Family of unknown function (DUF6600)
MKTKLLTLGMILVACVAAPACVTTYNPTYTQPHVAVADPEPVAPAAYESEPFYADLAPYGAWVWVEGPGWVWSPSNVQAGWRPYEMGHWVLTDYGWTWDSDENVGWVVYHYGRWHDDPYRGWVWVPGTEWGPAWVAWHEGGGWVGWAPLPYQVGWQAGVGLNWGGVNINVALGASSWHFVEARNMVDVGMYNHYAPVNRNVTLIQNTTNVTNYTYIDNRIVNNGVPPQKIGRAVGHEIHRCRVVDADASEQAQGHQGNGEEFVAYRPNPGRHGRMSVDRPVQANPERSNPERSGPEGTEPEQTPPQRMAPPLHPARPVPGWQRRIDSTQRTRGQVANPPAPAAPAEQEQPPSEPEHGRPNGAPAGHQHGNPYRAGQPPRPAAPTPAAASAPAAAPAQAGAPQQPAPSGQANRPAQPDAPAQPAAHGQSANRPPATPPAPANTPAGQARGKSAPGAAAQHGKKKPDAPKPDEAEADKPKQ